MQMKTFFEGDKAAGRKQGNAKMQLIQMHRSGNWKWPPGASSILYPPVPPDSPPLPDAF